MKLISVYSVLLLLLTLTSQATHKVTTLLVTTPVYHPLAETEVKFVQRAFVGWDLDNLYTSSAFYYSPYVAAKGEVALERDINLISVYGILVASNYANGVTTVKIDTAKAVKPKSHPFEIEEVAMMAAKALRLDYPDRKRFVIKIGDRTIERTEEGSVARPATATDSKPEGGKKPKPESEGRSK